MSSKTLKKYTSRFKRVKNILMQITPRDIEIIRQIHKHSLLTTNHILALIQGNQHQIKERLRKLFHNNFIGRPLQQLIEQRITLGEGTKPLIYSIGNKGADLLYQEFGIPRKKTDYTSRDREIGFAFIKHTILIADFMVSLELACQNHSNIRLINQEEIIKNASKEIQKKLKWQVKVKDMKIGIEPDKVLGLHFTDKPEGTNKIYFFLEADRAEMTQTRFRKKMIAYYYSWQQDLYKKLFGFTKIRLISITTTKQRINNMIQHSKTVDPKRPKGTNFFLFSENKNFEPFNQESAQKILSKIFIQAKDQKLISLID